MFNYYGISDNMPWMLKIIYLVKQMLYKSIKRKSQKSKWNWEKMNTVFYFNPLVTPKIKRSLWQ